MYYMKIAILIILYTAALLLLWWIFRPGAKKYYDSCSKIPLKDNAEVKGENQC